MDFPNQECVILFIVEENKPGLSQLNGLIEKWNNMDKWILYRTYKTITIVGNASLQIFKWSLDGNDLGSQWYKRKEKLNTLFLHVYEEKHEKSWKLIFYSSNKKIDQLSVIELNSRLGHLYYM